MTESLERHALAPAGWYPDPEDTSFVRYWDGRAWTGSRAASASWRPPVPVPAATGDDAQSFHLVMPVDTSVSAIFAGYLGVFSLLPNPLTPVPAVVCGILALRKIDREPTLRGRGRAWFGIVVGALSAVVTTYIAVMITLNA